MVRLSGLRIDRITIATVLAAVFLAGPALAREVGVTSAANPDVTGSPPDAASRVLYVGVDVFFNERIQTSAKGQAQILLLDGSAFTVGPNADLVIDEFVYNDRASGGQLVATLVEGVLRYVGGSLSKQPEGVTIKTPVAAIGIRGAIATVVVEPGSGSTTVTLIYGEEITIIGNDGKSVRLTSPGYQVTVTSGGAIGEPTRVSVEDIAAMLDALSGQPGSDGGADTPPTDGYVSTTEIVQLGSNSDPVITTAFTILPPLGGGDPTTDPADDSDTVQDGVDPVIEPAAEPPPESTISGRYLAAGDSYTLNWDPDNPIDDPGTVGLLGGSEDTDQAITGIEVDGDRLLVTLSSGDTLDLPYQTGDFSFTGADTPAGNAFGYGFVSDSGDFFYYELTLYDDPGTEYDETNRHFVLFSGEPLDPALATEADGSLEFYTIHPDAIQGLDVPFISAHLMPDTGDMNRTPLYVLMPKTGTVGTFPDGEATVALYGALMIQAEGSNQSSAVMLYVSTVWLNPDTGKYEIGAGRRGSVRLSSDSGPATFSGRIDAIADSDGNTVFGNGDYLVLGVDPAFEDAYNDSYADGAPEGGTHYTHGTRHLVTWDDTVDRSTLQRESRSLNMYAAGIAEYAWWMGREPVLFRTTGGDPTRSYLVLNAETNRPYAMLQMEDELDQITVGEMNLAFGRFPDSSGSSAFIDDDTYGARNNNANTTVTDDEGGDLPLLGNAFTYFFTNTLVPEDRFVPEGVTFCTCAFMEWGYWGGRLRYDDPTSDNPDDNHQAYFHLETWVAGELPDLTDIPTSGFASYSGHAIGDVYRDFGEGTLNYIAVGNFNMGWDFGKRLGFATISDFDGLTLSNTNGDMTSGDGLHFAGSIWDEGYEGEIRGSFVANGDDFTAGVMGDFGIIDDGGGNYYKATGTLMGEKDPPPM